MCLKLKNIACGTQQEMSKLYLNNSSSVSVIVFFKILIYKETISSKLSILGIII